MNPEEIDQVAQRLYEMMQGKAQPQEQLPGKELPFENVELVGEKVNYKIALNPEIFYRYSVFKAKVAASGKKCARARISISPSASIIWPAWYAC